MAELIAAVAAGAALLAWFETWRMRTLQERDFNFQRAADIRLHQFVYFAVRDLPPAPKPRDELRFTVENVGRAFAAEMNFAVDIDGYRHYVQNGLGLPPGVHSDLTVTLPPAPDLGERDLAFVYRYDDFRRHWGAIDLTVPDGADERYGHCRAARIRSARLDTKRNPAITESDVFMTPMRAPRWFDGLLRPYRRWRFRRDHPDRFARMSDRES